MTYSIILLESSIGENKAKLKDMAQRKEELIEELTQLHLSQGELKGSTDQMESELKATYDRLHNAESWGSINQKTVNQAPSSLSERTNPNKYNQ